MCVIVLRIYYFLSSYLILESYTSSMGKLIEGVTLSYSSGSLGPVPSGYDNKHVHYLRLSC